MPIISERNLYKGVNPHLNSYLQSKGSWESFHARHIQHLIDALEDVLPPHYASGFELDISLEDEEAWMSIGIYRASDSGRRGDLITRIEMLSPANMPTGSYYATYQRKRKESLMSGIHLVEIDYLHQSPPILPAIPDYSSHQADAYPFHVIVSDTLRQLVEVYSTSVDQPLPTFRLPLAQGEAIAFDLDAVYQRTCTSTRLFRHFSDYSQLPMNFERYHPDDQTRIQQRMAQIAATYATSTE